MKICLAIYISIYLSRFYFFPPEILHARSGCHHLQAGKNCDNHRRSFSLKENLNFKSLTNFLCKIFWACIAWIAPGAKGP